MCHKYTGITKGDFMIETLEDALERIKELEQENDKLRAELEDYKQRKNAGRKKHNSQWTESYNDFVIKYESGMTIVEIVSEGRISRRTAYRYKAYYDELKKKKEKGLKK